MVSVLTLAVLAAMLALPSGMQPRQRFNMVFPKNIVFGPNTVLVRPLAKSSGLCSVPLLNALNGRNAALEPRMPTIRPGTSATITVVEPPAPPCERWPLK